jgi:hypothetical protein
MSSFLFDVFSIIHPWVTAAAGLWFLGHILVSMSVSIAAELIRDAVGIGTFDAEQNFWLWLNMAWLAAIGWSYIFQSGRERRITPEFWRRTYRFVMGATVISMIGVLLVAIASNWSEAGALSVIFMAVFGLLLVLYVAGALGMIVGLHVWWSIIPYLLAKLVKKPLPFEKFWFSLPFITSIVTFSIFVGFIFFDNNPQASRYFQLNAAIKNTCYREETLDNCPTKLEDIRNLVREEYDEAQQKADLFYSYDAATHQYTLMVRYSPLHIVIFDPRLVDEYGMDFHEFDVETWGQDSVINPPKISGPWEHLPEWSGK